MEEARIRMGGGAPTSGSPDGGPVVLGGGSHVEEAELGQCAAVSYTPEMFDGAGGAGAGRRHVASRHTLLVALCGAAAVVCAVGGMIRGYSAGGAAPDALKSTKLMFGAGADGEDLANSILDSARAKYAASKQRLAAKHAAAGAGSQAVEDLARGAATDFRPAKAGAAPARAQAAAGKAAASDKKASAAAKKETALTLEQKIAQHKITTRDLVKEVREKQKQQAKQMAGALQDQTDDLIVASIKAMKQKETATGNKGTVGYVLSNALTRPEQHALASGAAKPASEPAATVSAPAPAAVAAAAAAGLKSVSAPLAASAPQANLDAKSVEQQAAAANPSAAERQSGVHPVLMETPPGLSLNKKAPNTEGMLSSYDQQLLKEGPDGIESSAPPPSPPAAAASHQPAPQYSPPQYQMQPYQQLAAGMPAAPFQQQMYAQPGPYGSPPQYPQYAQQPAQQANGYGYASYQYGQYEQPLQPQQQQMYQGGEPYQQLAAGMPAAPFQQQMYAQPGPYGSPPQYPQYAQQPAQQANGYGYASYQYGQYEQPLQPQQQQQQMYKAQVTPSAPPAPPPSPEQLLEKAKRLDCSEMHVGCGSVSGSGSATGVQHVPKPQALAAYTTAGPGGKMGGGGLLWRMFTAPEQSGPSPVAPMNKHYSAIINNNFGGFGGGQQQMAVPPAPQSLAQSAGSSGEDSMASIDPQNLGVGSNADAKAALSMGASAKQAIKAKMEALRQGILNDFKKTTDMGAQAGYLPPPPMP